MRPQFVAGTWKRALPPLGLALVALPFSLALALVLVGVAGFVLYFFRDPDRTPPSEGVLSPADGRVSVVREEQGRIRVGVFMNVTDVHVNRAPLSGTVESVTHRPGAHRPAFSKDSERNERVDIHCGAFEVSLIAGAFARRIFPAVDPGEDLTRGQRIGHIAFGSRADVLLPVAYGREDVCVERGERVVAGESVVASRE